jgi:hypothetical protein
MTPLLLNDCLIKHPIMLPFTLLVVLVDLTFIPTILVNSSLDQNDVSS